MNRETSDAVGAALRARGWSGQASWHCPCGGHENGDASKSLTVSTNPDGSLVVNCHVHGRDRFPEILAGFGITTSRGGAPTSTTAPLASSTRSKRPPRDFRSIIEEYRLQAIGLVLRWAKALGVRFESPIRYGAFVLTRSELERFEFGFDGKDTPDSALAWPEFDGADSVVGLVARAADGRKGSARGSTRGIGRPREPLDRSSTLYCTEGASDAWALDSIGLSAIARPSNSIRGKVEAWLADFLSVHRGPLVFVLDRKQGEKSIPLIEALAVKLRRPIRYGDPPGDAEDCRDWLRAQIAAGLILGNDSARRTAGLEFASEFERNARDARPPASNLAPRTLADVESRKIDWLWRPVLAVRFGTLIAGRHGSNKSTLLGWIVAQVTRGRPLPGAPPTTPRPVLFIAGEDRERETLRPRLEAAGADLSLVKLPPSGLMRASLAEILAWAEQDNRVPRGALVVVDPISSFVPPGFKDNETASVRGLLGLVESFAERNDWAIAFVRHPNKSTEGAARLRVAGSGAWVDTPRLSWLVAPDRDHENRRFLVPLKLNVAPDKEGFAFVVEIRDVEGADPQPVVENIETGVTRTADEILAANDASEDERSDFERARDWLDDRMPPGVSKLSADLHKAASQEGIQRKTLTRAAKALRIDMRYARPDVHGPWTWYRPYSRSGHGSGSVPDEAVDHENRRLGDELAVQSVQDNISRPCPEQNGRMERTPLADSRDRVTHPGQHPQEGTELDSSGFDGQGAEWSPEQA